MLSTLINYWTSNRVEKKEHRTPVDAIRLTTVLLMVDNRSSVSRFLSNKRTREMMDQAVNPDVALFEQLLSTFINPDFNEINRLDEMNVIDEDHSILSNDKSIFTNKERDTKWLLHVLNIVSFGKNSTRTLEVRGESCRM